MEFLRLSYHDRNPISFSDRGTSILFGVIFFLVVVVPNSFQSLTIFFLVLTCSVILLFNGRIMDLLLLFWWAILSSFFLVYITLSPIGDTEKMELIFKYILSPIFWIIIFSYVKRKLDSTSFMRYLLFLCFIANLSVIIFYIAMYSGHTSIVNFLVDSPNLDSNTGLGFTLHVYGSLIFFSIALGPSLVILRKPFLMSSHIILLVISSVLSGRTALIFFLFIGLIFSFYFVKNKTFSFKIYLKFLSYLFLFFFLILQLYNVYFDIDFFDFLNEVHVGKILETGDDDRGIQTKMLLDKFFNMPLGTGFIPVDLIRNDLQNWRYEVLILATLMRFGVLTFFLIIVSLVPSIYYFFKSKIYRSNIFHIFLLLGFFGLFFASFTNPYLESFCFQWMFFGPLVLLRKNMRIFTNC